VACFVDQCSTGNHKCHGRACTLNEDWSYTCGSCQDGYVTEGDYDCAPSSQLIISIAVPLAIFLLVVAIIIILILYFRTKKINLFLPHNWIWEPSYFEKQGYYKSKTTPAYWSKEIDLKNTMNESKEYKLFNYLKQLMDFDEMMITKAIAISAPFLADMMSKKRQVFVNRFKSNPEIFVNQKWKKEKSNPQFRTKTMEHFQRQLIDFEWNSSLNITDAPIIAVAHATGLKKATKILEAGFAKLNTVDDGYYGKGIYFSTSAIYTVPYCINQSDPCILLSFLLPGNPFPVIEHPRIEDSFLAKPIFGGYQSNYVVVLGNGFPWKENDAKYRTFNEIVIDQEDQVVPIFLVFFSPSPGLQKVLDVVDRDVPENKRDEKSDKADKSEKSEKSEKSDKTESEKKDKSEKPEKDILDSFFDDNPKKKVNDESDTSSPPPRTQVSPPAPRGRKGATKAARASTPTNRGRRGRPKKV
jgi:hypothetical protein